MTTTPQTEAPPDAAAEQLKRIADTLDRSLHVLEAIRDELVDARRRQALSGRRT